MSKEPRDTPPGQLKGKSPPPLRKPLFHSELDLNAGGNGEKLPEDKPKRPNEKWKKAKRFIAKLFRADTPPEEIVRQLVEKGYRKEGLKVSVFWRQLVRMRKARYWSKEQLKDYEDKYLRKPHKKSQRADNVPQLKKADNPQLRKEDPLIDILEQLAAAEKDFPITITPVQRLTALREYLTSKRCREIFGVYVNERMKN